MEVVVLRIGHRKIRDQRITSHVCLVARAFGAKEVIISGDYDSSIEDTVKKVVDRWGDSFKVTFTKDPTSVISRWKEAGGEVVHLTMYGLNLPVVIDKIKASAKPKLVIVGAKRVPKDIYNLANYNVAVGNQPHSEVAALAIFMDRLLNSVWTELSFRNAKLRIIPCEKGKRVERIKW